ncbi:MAG: 4-hydroxy-tetrahydrodipicolinate reductase [Candidatus Eremiobacteraeota bacterium]|nr:4-hydroxy-tetrahydrodipicolinate reductase [Candidatus Eremiobacteraeota bacterium]
MNSEKIRVLISGIAGRMGRVLSRTIISRHDIILVAGFDINSVGIDIGILAGMGQYGLSVSDDLRYLLEKYDPDVMVDFTRADAAYDNLKEALNFGVGCVVGTTGIPAEKLEELGELARQQDTCLFFAPNFSPGAVLMMEFARLASPHFSWAEIIEQHHENKLDSPSGTALRTAEIMRKEKGRDFQHVRPENEKLKGTRGGETWGIHIHSIRMPGRLAHQEVILGGMGETLIIRHDTIDRTCFMPGVLMAIRAVPGLKGLQVGLDKLLFKNYEEEIPGK